MAKYRKKPVVIEAVQIPKSGESDLWATLTTFLGARHPWELAMDGGVNITTLEGVMHGSVGDFIIRGVQGELYPCKPDIFAATYEAVEEEPHAQ
jgi:hypothetical protein